MSTAGRVVVGVSGTPSSLEALRASVSEARRRQAMLLAVLAWQPPGGEIAYARSPNPALTEFFETEAVGRLRQSFEAAFGGCPQGVDVLPMVVRGEPGPVLVQVAERTGDLLVLGAGERGRAARLFHGRVARYCVARARCPVLTVPPPALLCAVPRPERHRLPRPVPSAPAGQLPGSGPR